MDGISWKRKASLLDAEGIPRAVEGPLREVAGLSFGKGTVILREAAVFPLGIGEVSFRKREGISGWKRKVFLRKEKESFFSNSCVGTVVVVREA